ncbi:HNH endonuclease signature motif containing protein [Spirillospora sp. NPDC048832]
MGNISKAERAFRDDMAAYGLKFCSGCKLFQPVGMFGKNAGRRDGMRACCRPCDSARVMRYQKTDTGRAAKHAAQARYRAAKRADDPDYDRDRKRNATPEAARAAGRRRRAIKARVYRAAYDESAILARNGGRCVYCDAEPATALDHFVPLSWGSDDAPWNLVGACKPCNSSKHDADPYEWLESRGVDVDAWERRHIAGWFDLPRKAFKIARVYRPPVG